MRFGNTIAGRFRMGEPMRFRMWDNVLMAQPRSYPLRFLFRFLGEVAALTKPEKFLASLVVLAGIVFQAIRDGISPALKDVAFAGCFSILWATCIFGCWLSFKAARALYHEDIKAFEEFEPTLQHVGGDLPARKRPSMRAAAIPPLILSALLIMVILLSSRYVPKNTSSLEEPAVKIEPEHAILTSASGSFMLNVLNSGVDIDHIWVTRNYFIAQNENSALRFKILLSLECGPDHASDVLPLEFNPSPDFEGTIDGSVSPVSVKQVGPGINLVLRSHEHFQVAVTYAGWVLIAYEAARTAFHGKGLLGVRVVIVFHRFSDQKEFKRVQVFQLSEDAKQVWSLSPPSVINIRRPPNTLTMEDVVPYMQSTDNWYGLKVHYKAGKIVSID